MLLVERRGPDEFAARFLCPVSFYEFAGARDAEVSHRLAQVFAQDRGAGVKSGPARRGANVLAAWLWVVPLAART